MLLEDIIHYVIPSFIGAVAGIIIGLLPYLRSRKETESELSVALKNRIESCKAEIEIAIALNKTLTERVETLERENKELRDKLNEIHQKDIYIRELENKKLDLEKQIKQLILKVNSMGKALDMLIEIFSNNLIKFNQRDKVKVEEILHSIKEQLS